MQGIAYSVSEIKRLSPNDGLHYFYGYYDNPAFARNDSVHLCNRVKFWDRLPTRNDVCELGLIDIATGAWRGIATTQAFNFQQGAMLQWNPQNPDSEVIYNVREGDEYRAVVYNIENGAVRKLPRAVANVSQDGKFGLAVNMNRLFDFRPGYGYSDVRDTNYDVPQPTDDGIFVVDMQAGTDKLILSYKEMGKLFGVAPHEKLVVNHLTFSPNNRRLLFLVRTFPQNGEWTTGMGVIDFDGGNFCLLNPMSMASHYHWRDGDHLLVWASHNGVPGMYLYTDKSDEVIAVNPEFFPKDIHCIYSPNLNYIIGDGYLDAESYRHMYLYSTLSKNGTVVLRVKSDPVSTGDIRTDLHNRWSKSGKLVSFDSTHEGFRGLYLIDISDTLAKT